MSVRGYFGVVLYQPKTIANAGMILRSAVTFGASFLCTVGHRYHRQAGDTVDAMRHFPGFHFRDLEECLSALPQEASIVRVEVDGEYALQSFHHPERAVYILGGEDRSVPVIATSTSVRIATRRCLNLAVSTSIVFYDRCAKYKE